MVSITHRLLHVLAAMLPIHAFAQYSRIHSPEVASLSVVAGTEWLDMPIVTLGGDKNINISFDCMGHGYRRLAYRLEHCDAEWNTSEDIFASDYCEGFADGNVIEHARESVNTNVAYTHYSLQIPNGDCVPKIGGNYRLHVYDDNEGDTLLTACFMINENIVRTAVSATSNTDIGVNGRHQQVAAEVAYGTCRTSDPQRNFRTVVMQNGRWETARRDMRPQTLNAMGMGWNNCCELIFDGGNEYRKFEILDVFHPALGIERIDWDGSNYNAYIWEDGPRRNYVYDEDANGAYCIRTDDYRDDDVMSEYIIVHFTLNAPRQAGRVFVEGKWTCGPDNSLYEMHYNDTLRRYEGKAMLKQGYYSYHYVVVQDDGRVSQPESEGCFWQTENTYETLVYYKGDSERAFRLVGYGKTNFRSDR